MAKVRSKGNRTTEIALANGFRLAFVKGWRRHLVLEGTKPDFVFSSKKVAVFVDGCFWHCCPIHGSFPKTNRNFWLKKLNANKERDLRNDLSLTAAGWRVVRFWEHEIKSDLNFCVEAVKIFL